MQLQNTQSKCASKITSKSTKRKLGVDFAWKRSDFAVFCDSFTTVLVTTNKANTSSHQSKTKHNTHKKNDKELKWQSAK